MKVTKDNYEAFLLDWKEGTLTKPDEEALFSFLEAHPHLKEYDFELLTLHPDPQSIFSKRRLHFEVPCEENRTYFYVAALENELNEIENKQFQVFLAKNKRYQKEFNQFKKTRLTPVSVSYPDKSSLHAIAEKETKTLFLPKRWWSVAAVLLFIIGSAYFFTLKEEVTRPSVSIAELIPELNRNSQDKNEAQSEVSTKVAAKEKTDLDPPQEKKSPRERNIKQPRENKTVKAIHEIREKTTEAKTTRSNKFPNERTRIEKEKRASEELTLVVESLNPDLNQEENLTNKSDAQIVQEITAPISISEYLLNNITKKTPLAKLLNNNKTLLETLNEGLSKINNEEQYIAKKEGDRMKTCFKIGQFSLERNIAVK